MATVTTSAERTKAQPTVPAQCIVCAAVAPRRLFHRDGKDFWGCSECALVFVYDIHPEYDATPDYLIESCRGYDRAGAKPKQRRDYAALLAEFETFRQENRIVEVGCGAGLFLGEAAHRGWSCLGIDVLPDASAATKRAGVDVHVGELAGAALRDDTVDAIYMNEVIEHVVDPVALLREARRVLRPGGVALLRTGNARSWSARLRGRRWDYYRFGPLMHIRFYSPRAAESLARIAGFSSVRSSTRGFAFLESAEMRGRWYKLALKACQALVSPLAGPFGAGHRLTMRFYK